MSEKYVVGAHIKGFEHKKFFKSGEFKVEDFSIAGQVYNEMLGYKKKAETRSRRLRVWSQILRRKLKSCSVSPPSSLMHSTSMTPTASPRRPLNGPGLNLAKSSSESTGKLLLWRKRLLHGKRGSAGLEAWLFSWPCGRLFPGGSVNFDYPACRLSPAQSALI